MTDDRGQKVKLGGQRSEVGDQMTEDRDQLATGSRSNGQFVE